LIQNILLHNLTNHNFYRNVRPDPIINQFDRVQTQPASFTLIAIPTFGQHPKWSVRHTSKCSFQTDHTLISADSLMTPQSWLAATTPRFAMQELQHTKLLEQTLTKSTVRINLDETKATFVIRRSHRRLPELSLFNHYTRWSRKVKYFGVTSDRELLWNRHIYNTANRT
jgi:hypothetical protein